MYKVILTKQALKDLNNLKAAGISNKAKMLSDLIKNDPFVEIPPYEKLRGNLTGLYSRRINIKHRLVYQVNPETQIVKIVSMWSHYENIN